LTFFAIKPFPLPQSHFPLRIWSKPLPIEGWHENIRDPTIADAILDRLIHSAHKINLKGESMRKLRSPLTDSNNYEK
jgi:hypothetical protein